MQLLEQFDHSQKDQCCGLGQSVQRDYSHSHRFAFAFEAQFTLLETISFYFRHAAELKASQEFSRARGRGDARADVDVIPLSCEVRNTLR
jgi:hypothetical protein